MTRIIKRFLDAADVKRCKEISIALNNWDRGRQETGYERAYLKDVIGVQNYITRAIVELGILDDMWDAYFLRYPNGSYIPPHKDDTAFGRTKHMRLNALISKPDDGGVLVIDDKAIKLNEGDAVIFTPNLSAHSVSKVVGERLVFSVGCLI